MQKILLTIALLGIGSVRTAEVQPNADRYKSQNIIARFEDAHVTDLQSALNALARDFKVSYDNCEGDIKKALFTNILAARLSCTESLQPHIDLIIAAIISGEEIILNPAAEVEATVTMRSRSASIESETEDAAKFDGEIISPACQAANSTALVATSIPASPVLTETAKPAKIGWKAWAKGLFTKKPTSQVKAVEAGKVVVIKTNADLSEMIKAIKSIATVQGVEMLHSRYGTLNHYTLNYETATFQLQYSLNTRTVYVIVEKDAAIMDRFIHQLQTIVNPQADLTIPGVIKTGVLAGLFTKKPMRKVEQISEIKTDANLSTLEEAVKSIASIESVDVKSSEHNEATVAFKLKYENEVRQEAEFELQYNPNTKTVHIKGTNLLNEFARTLQSILNPQEPKSDLTLPGVIKTGVFAASAYAVLGSEVISSGLKALSL